MPFIEESGHRAPRDATGFQVQAAPLGDFFIVSLTQGTAAVFLQAIVDLCYLMGSIHIKTLCARQDILKGMHASFATGLAYGSIFALVGLGFTLNKSLLMAFGGSSTSALAPSVIALYLIVIAFILMLVRKVSSGGSDSTGEAAPVLVFDVINETDLRSNKALRTQYHISEREMDVIVLLMGGESITAASKALSLSENTVKSHIKKIYSKLGVHTKDEFRQLVRSIADTGSMEAARAPRHMR